ncbi:MAG: enoyl-CoA hydratase-related protein, partial [Actinomycetota bacterium]
MSRLTTERHDTTVVLRLDAPDRRNALDLPTMRELVERLGDADADETVRAIVLTGTDPAFCAGLDLEAVAAGELDPAEVAQADADPWQALQRLATPTIAAVNGAAVTGGLELVLCCDLVIASPRARFADTHARVGIHPSGGMTVLLPRIVGWQAAVGMSLTGRFVDAAEAHRLGLVSEVVEHADLERSALAAAASIAGTDAATTRAILATY